MLSNSLSDIVPISCFSTVYFLLQFYFSNCCPHSVGILCEMLFQSMDFSSPIPGSFFTCFFKKVRISSQSLAVCHGVLWCPESSASVPCAPVNPQSHRQVASHSGSLGILARKLHSGFASLPGRGISCLVLSCDMSR